jgi:hypothetical protein
MSLGASNKVFSKQAAELFDKYIGQYGEHCVLSRGEIYIQPYVDLSLHLIQMHLEGWTDVDFDLLAVISGASALFGYQSGEFGPKYAHLQLEPDKRIAEATGFGYEWQNFDSIEEAWTVVKNAVAAGRVVKGWDWENILFAGYEDAVDERERKVYALADGPATYAKWLNWEEFSEWAQRVMNWKAAQFGLFSGSVPIRPTQEIATDVLKHLVVWSKEVPVKIQKQHKQAIFGIPAIEAQALEVEDIQKFPNFVSCHGLNPQWTLRRSTALYLEYLVDSGIFPDDVNLYLITAAKQYHGAYSTWKAFYEMVGHRVPDEVRNMPVRRSAAAGLVRSWQAHEKAAVNDLENALSLL